MAFDRMPILKPYLTLAAALIIAFCVGCSARNSGERRGNANVEAEPPPIAITVGRSEAREIAATIQATGSFVAQETSDIAPKVAGKVANVSVNVGQFATQGAVVAKIDDRDARQELTSSQASVKQAIAAVRQAEARLGLGPNGKFNSSSIPEVRVAAANHEQALAELRQAETNEKRYRELVETGDVAAITYDQFRTQRDTARARANATQMALEAAVNAAKQNNQAIVSAEAAVESARAQVAIAQQAVADTVIRAPFSGYISARPVAVGEFVSTASIIATILRTNPIKIQIQVAEADVPLLTVGRGVSVLLDAYKDRRFAGTVSAVNPAVDPVSRSATVEALIENGDNALRPGMFGSVRITSQGGLRAVFAPRSAVYSDQATQSYRVFVVQDGVAKLQVVQLGTEEGDYWQIVSGLDADQTVATSNLDQLYEGAKVAY